VAAIVANSPKVDREQLLRNLAVSVETNTEILTFAYTDPSPVVAQRLADDFAGAYLQYRRKETLNDLLAVSDSVQQRIQELNGELAKITQQIASTPDETKRATLQSQATAIAGQVGVLQQELADLTPPDRLRVGQVVSPADLPEEPASPNHIVNGLLGLTLGLALGVGLAFLRERLDDRLRGRDDLEVAAEAPVLASIPRVPSWKRKESAVLVTFAEPKSAAAEAYRTLRTSVLFAMGQSNAKVLMVTSPHAGDGKTTTTANLATVLGQAGKRVVLVSADLRKPRVHQFFGLETKTGLTNVLAGEVSPWQAVRPTHIENLQVLAAGPIPGNPAELLGSDAMGNLLSALAETSDIVIVDAAPVLAVSDALAMVTLTDGVLLVADAEETHRGAVQHARRQLHQVDARIIGAVFNNFDPERAAAYSYYGGYGYYGSPRYEQPAPANDEVVSEQRRFFRRSG